MKTINSIMKAFALLTVCTLPIAARGADFFDNFESYAVDSQIHGQGGWKGWGNDVVAAAFVSGAFAFSGTKSVNISAGSDLVHEFSGATNGLWTFSVMQYVPSSSAGRSFLDLYSKYTDAGPWDSGVKTHFDMGTDLVTATIGNNATLPLIKDQWVPYRAEIDLDADTVSEYYNNKLLSTHTWAGTLKAIQSVNFYFNKADPVYYDNVALTPTIAKAGSLSGSFTTSPTAVNLTAVGTSDWVHWESADPATHDRKSTGGSQISTFTVVGTGTVLTYDNDLRPMSWTDGTPTASSTGNLNGVYIDGINNGFSVTVPADTTARTVSFYVGGWRSTGELTAHLSDSSGPDYVQSSTTGGTGQYNRNYTITYAATSAGQTLTLTWKMTAGTGNVTLNGAALAIPVAPPRLSIVRNAGGSVTISTSSGRIHQSDSLSTPNWTDAGTGPITVVQPTGARFYRRTL